MCYGTYRAAAGREIGSGRTSSDVDAGAVHSQIVGDVRASGEVGIERLCGTIAGQERGKNQGGVNH